MPHSIVGRWGRSLALRLPADVAARFALSEGSAVDVSWRDQEIVIRKVEKPKVLRDLFEGKSEQEWRELYRGHDVDWGPDLGREIVDE